MKTEFPERYITLGLKIAYYRKKAGLTQEMVKKQSGGLSLWETLVGGFPFDFLSVCAISQLV